MSGEHGAVCGVDLAKCGASQLEEGRANHPRALPPPVSTAQFAGARLVDVLAKCGASHLEEGGANHVHFVGLDEMLLEEGGANHVHFVGLDEMLASIPVDKAEARNGDVILAYDMN
ncbi:hypothetical protein T484DRAFT_1767575, partial [Baffinella frigidus]